MDMYRWVPLLAVLWGCSPSAPETPSSAEDATRSVDEEWFVISLEGTTAGSVHLTTTELEGGGYAVDLVQELRIQRVNTPLDIRVSLRMEEDANGQFTGYSSEQGLAANTIRTRGEVLDGSLVLHERGPDGKERSSSIPALPGAVGFHFAEKKLQALFAEKAPASGTTLEIVSYLPELRRFGKETTTIQSREQVVVAGRTRELWRTVVRQEALPGFVVKRWVDDEGRLQKYSIPLLGMEIVYERRPREEVEFMQVSSPPEVFVSTSIAVERHVVRDCEEAVYRLHFKQGETDVERETLFHFAGQEGRSTGDDEMELRVRRVKPSEPLGLPVALPANDDGQTLRPNTYIQSDDTKIREAALAAIGSEEDAWTAARKIERWVHEKVDEKNLETAFATATEVLSTGRGDCTEHSVLFTAMARAVGIPARVVSGLLYSDGAFVGHMWSEVYIGEWIPLDATIGRGTVGADHIALSSSSLDGAAMGDMFIRLVRVLGNLGIEVLSSR
jgi:hypothetical protein